MSSQINVIINSGSIVDLSMTPIARGRITFRATDANDKSLPVTVAGGKQAINEDVSLPITNGSMVGALTLPHPATSYPTNYRLRITIWDSATNKQTVYKNVAISDDGGGNWNFTNWLSTQSSAIPLPTAPGPAGMTWRGAWTANTAYAFRDALIYNGSAYYVTTGFTSGSTFDGTNLSLLASAGNFAIGTVTTGASGSPASATLVGTAPNQVLNLVLPAGPSVPSLPVYISSATGNVLVQEGSFFFATALDASNIYDIWQKVSGSPVLIGSLPKQLINPAPTTNPNGSPASTFSGLRLKDSQGFIYDLFFHFQRLMNQVANLQAEGLTEFATTAAAVTAYNSGLIGDNALFFVPAASSDNAYDVYKIAAGVATLQISLQKSVVNSTNSTAPLRLVDSQGFVVTIAGVGSTSPFLNQLLATRDAAVVQQNLQAAIAKLNVTCIEFSRKVQATCLPTLMAPTQQYNMNLWYGQSLSVGYQTTAYMSSGAKYGNLMVGTAMGYNASMQPWTDSLFHPLVEAKTNATGETECSGMSNTAKKLLNNHRLTTNDTGRTFVAQSVGHPGVSVNYLTPTAPMESGTAYPGNYWTGLANMMTAFANAAATASNGGSGVGTAGGTGFFYCQGENDIGASVGGDPGLVNYMAAVQSIRAGFDAICLSKFSQSQQAGFYTYQTGAQYTSDPTNLAMQNAQWIQALNNQNWFMFGPHYPYPDLGGHLTANSYRWLGSQAGKVWFRTAVLRQGWQPLQPYKVNAFDSKTLLVGFHVPVPPLQNITAYAQSTPVGYADLGFNLLDAAGYVGITVSIVAEQVVQITAARAVDWTTAQLRYADTGPAVAPGTQHLGTGNLCDSDPAVADDVYVQSSAQQGTPDGTAYDYAGLIGQPYPLYNWCIAFSIKIATFNSTGPQVY